MQTDQKYSKFNQFWGCSDVDVSLHAEKLLPAAITC